MTDPQFNAKDLREQRLPIVSDCRLRFKMSFANIAREVEMRCGQQVNKMTIKRDWDYLVKQWRDEAAANAKDLCDEELMAIDVMIAELSRLYEQSKQPKKTKHDPMKSMATNKNNCENAAISKLLSQFALTDTEQAGVVRTRLGDVRILAEMRKWCERRDKLLGLNKLNVDITSGGEKFAGFSSVLPVIPNIEEIVKQSEASHALSDE